MPSGSDPPRHTFTEEEADELLLKKAIVDDFQTTPNWQTVVENGLLPAAIAEAVVDVWKATWEIRERFPDDSSIDTLVVRACSQVYDIRFRGVPGYEKATDRISALYPFLTARERKKMNSLLHKVAFSGGSAIPSKHTFGPTFKRQFQRLYCVSLYALFSKESIKSSSMNLWILDNAQQLWFVPPTQVPEMRPLLAAHKASLVRPDVSEGIRARAELVGAPAHAPLPVAAPTTTPESSLALVVQRDPFAVLDSWLLDSERAERDNMPLISDNGGETQPGVRPRKCVRLFDYNSISCENIDLDAFADRLGAVKSDVSKAQTDKINDLIAEKFKSKWEGQDESIRDIVKASVVQHEKDRMLVQAAALDDFEDKVYQMDVDYLNAELSKERDRSRQ